MIARYAWLSIEAAITVAWIVAWVMIALTVTSIVEAWPW